MRDYELEVLEQYDISIQSTRKMRGAFFCDTNEGAMLLKETCASDRHALFLYDVLHMLEEKGHKNVDLPVYNKEGKLKSERKDGACYMLKHWFSGRECDVKKESDLLTAAESLAALHNDLSSYGADIMTGEEAPVYMPVGRSLKEEFMRHSREMKKVREFIRKKVSKGSFEFLYLENYERMSRLAQKVIRREESSCCEELYQKSVRQKMLTHGDYNYHNVMITPKGAAVTNFDRCHVNVQVKDLCYFLRKVMEKNGWNENLGREILCAYQKERLLSLQEKEYIAIGLSYPEKFWKTANTYYHSNKAWIPEKNVEKLKTAISQTDKRLEFTENIFPLNL